MFQKDHIPILIDLPNTLDYADIYFIHDVHYGSELFDDKKWEELKTEGHVNAIMAMAKEQGAAMDEAIKKQEQEANKNKQ